MTLEKVRKKKQKLIAEKPSSKQAALNYDLFNEMMDDWARQLDELTQQERQLVEEAEKMELETRGKISNLEKRRANRFAMMEMLKNEYRRVGLDRRFNKKTKDALQWELAQRIVDLEAEVQEFSDEIDTLVEMLISRV